MDYNVLIGEICDALLAGPWNRQGLFERLSESFGPPRAWMRHVSGFAYNLFPGARAPRLGILFTWLINDSRIFKKLVAARPKRIKILLTPTPEIDPPEKLRLGPPELRPPANTDGDLCRWLKLKPNQLDWFANTFSREHDRHREVLRHYSYCWIKKRSGGWRLLEMPKSKLKEIQRRIHADILINILPHPCAHGFAASNSISAFVQAHVNRPLVLRMDLKDFFISVEASRIHAIFRMAGYSEHIARTLTGLCTNTVPTSEMRSPDFRESLTPSQRLQLRIPHLPQGAPTSPALANLSAYHLDARLEGLAQKFGWVYSRYADDLLFSGPILGKKLLAQFQLWVADIARDEHFRVNPLKTRVMRQAVSQHAAGLVLNEKPNISRKIYDELKAILTNCTRTGPATQNRAGHPNFKAHLEGRIAHVRHINPVRGDRLLKLFKKIDWQPL